MRTQNAGLAVVTSAAEGNGSEIPATPSVRHERSDMPAALLLLFNRLQPTADAMHHSVSSSSITQCPRAG